DIMASSGALMAYACALPAFMIIKVLVPAFFARKDTKTPVKIGLVAVGINIVASIFAALLFGFVGLAVATAISAWTHVILLMIIMIKKDMIHIALIESLNWIKAVLGAICMVMVLYFVDKSQTWWLESADIARAMQLILLVGIGISVYIISLLILGVRFRHLKSS
ncbi:MAG: polysaccharide biosynthesis C-terminal domain-containing protein, partial [Saccharospirillaceae bacterium]|nr:polysaccharide biosynthesis C-terminal domain-containing protein [Pseudomonadales bacterium]NRB78927.1 polysaccharide biosynthesis C-terminal domain-containing protein [Saccharospirillaceae bacterium]